MNPHPKTIEYIRAACQRPGMYMADFDLRQLEMQLHGFDAALAAVDALGGYVRFNEDFTNFVVEEVGVSGSQGWAAALVLRFGSGKPAFDSFCSLLSIALLDAFDEGVPCKG
jgi:hypothetical protein